MGQTLYISLDRPIANVEINNDRVFLAGLVGDARSMNSLARKLGTVSLNEFQSYSPEDLEDLVDDVAELPSDPIKWFDPADAIPAVRGLQKHYTETRFVVERGRRHEGQWEPVDRTDDLLRELQDLENILSEAEKAGVKFRFHIGF